MGRQVVKDPGHAVIAVYTLRSLGVSWHLKDVFSRHSFLSVLFCSGIPEGEVLGPAVTVCRDNVHGATLLLLVCHSRQLYLRASV